MLTKNVWNEGVYVVRNNYDTRSLKINYIPKASTNNNCRRKIQHTIGKIYFI